MNYYKLILIILVVFFKTGNVLSISNIFDVNNIEVEKKGKISNEVLANRAIKKGFKELINKILLDSGIKKLNELKFSEIKELVTYYQISDTTDINPIQEKIYYNISFNKDKMHDLFYNRGISYSEITNKDLFILPILKKNNQVYVYNKNFFYENWNEFYNTDLVEFILPLENIEIIQNINFNKNNLLNLELKNLFSEYSEKNLALVIIQDNNFEQEKIYLKSQIGGKSILSNIIIKKLNLSDQEFYKKIIINVKKELTKLVKSQNLIDVRVPSFLNAEIKIDKINNLVELKSRLKKIDTIENVYIQEFNNELVFLKIKYLGKIDKIIKKLDSQNIILKLINDIWSIKII
jgi:hypothetical protein